MTASAASDIAAMRPLRARPSAVIMSPKREPPSEAVTKSPASADLRRANDGDVEVLDLFAQRIAIEPQETGRAQLVPAGCPQREGQKRPFDLCDHAIVHAVRRQPVAMGGKERLKMAVDRVGQVHVTAAGAAALRRWL